MYNPSGSQSRGNGRPPDGRVSFKEKLTEAYYDATIEKVFRPSWFVLGAVTDVPKAGSYFVYDVPTFGTSVLVVRDTAGNLGAFHNFCRHRGKKIVQTQCAWAEGKAHAFTCWLHGWTYDLEGRLRTVPGEQLFVDLDKGELGLKPIMMEIWAGLILCYFGSGEPPDLKTYLGGLYEGFDGYYTEMERIATFSADVKVNWQFAMDAFSEGYHVAFLHRNTQPEVLPLGVGRSAPPPPVETFGPHTRRSGGPITVEYKGGAAERAIFRHGRKLTPTPESDSSLLPPGVNPTRMTDWFFDHVFLFPNISILHGAHWFSSVIVWPIDRDHSRVITTHYARKARHAGDRIAQAYMRGVLVGVTREDFGAMEEVQEGAMSAAFDYFKLSMAEMGIIQRYALIDRMIKS